MKVDDLTKIGSIRAEVLGSIVVASMKITEINNLGVFFLDKVELQKATQCFRLALALLEKTP